MNNICIEGGNPLSGSVSIQGSKNAALPMMAAALLHPGLTTLQACPRIKDVFWMEKILQHLGAKTHWQGDCITIDCSGITSCHVPREYANSMRSSVILMGSMLGRLGKAVVPYPGGCVIGKRPIDIHIQMLQKMGVYIKDENGVLQASVGELTGHELTFPKSSVGATENALLAAVKAKGTTVLHGCAREPEITHLCSFLKAMGARIEGQESETLIIHGGASLHDTVYRVPADRIAAGTYLYAGAITRGRVTLENAPLAEMGSILDVYEKMGGQYEVNSGKLVSDSTHLSKNISYLETSEHPGFPTDMQSILLAVLTTVQGISHLQENVFEDRYKVVPLLNQMGARILTDGRDALIDGGRPLRGSNVFAMELRGGAALVLAGLAAKGITVIDNPDFIERGYEDICGHIAALGGKIKRNTGD